jgi:hypothetical protein
MASGSAQESSARPAFGAAQSPLNNLIPARSLLNNPISAALQPADPGSAYNSDDDDDDDDL